MRRIVLFQFHREWEVCRARIALLRALNPDVPIYGLFGGESSEDSDARACLGPLLDGFHSVGWRDARWKWANTDLCVRDWFREAGHRIEFDRLHVIQWDFLLFEALDSAYTRVAADAVGFSGLTRLDTIADVWAWTVDEPLRRETNELAEWARARFGDVGAPLACQGPGYCLPREFLVRYASCDVPELGHDELRLPLFAQIFGLEMVDVGFYPRWFDPAVERFFNADDAEVDVDAVRSELSDPRGRRAFHPCRSSYGAVEIQELLVLLAGTPRR